MPRLLLRLKKIYIKFRKYVRIYTYHPKYQPLLIINSFYNFQASFCLLTYWCRRRFFRFWSCNTFSFFFNNFYFSTARVCINIFNDGRIISRSSSTTTILFWTSSITFFFTIFLFDRRIFRIIINFFCNSIFGIRFRSCNTLSWCYCALKKRIIGKLFFY